MNAQGPRVSVIVPAYQAEDHLPSCLAALARQTAASSSFEILVVDDGSTDRTAQAALNADVRCLSHERNRGTAAARNTGAREAQAGVLLFLDADVVADEGLVGAVLELFEAESDGEVPCQAATGRYDAEPANEGWFPRYKGLWTWFCWNESAARRGESDHLQGALCAVRRALFWKIDGFDECYEGGNVEDYEFSTRLQQAGVTILFEPRIAGRHYFPGFAAAARNYAARTRMWLRLRFGTRQNDSRVRLGSGQANPRSGAGAVLALLAVAAHVGALADSRLLAAALVLDLAYFGSVLPFLRAALARQGTAFAVYALAVHFSLSVVVAMAALSTPLGRGSRSAERAKERGDK